MAGHCAKIHNSRRSASKMMQGDLWVERVVSVNIVPWVGDGVVSGISLSEESSVDDKNGEVAGSGGDAGVNVVSAWGGVGGVTVRL
ncbi:hypothetical protein Tco_0257009 [Tanacetum coccineum]